MLQFILSLTCFIVSLCVRVYVRKRHLMRVCVVRSVRAVKMLCLLTNRIYVKRNRFHFDVVSRSVERVNPSKWLSNNDNNIVLAFWLSHTRARTRLCCGTLIYSSHTSPPHCVWSHTYRVGCCTIENRTGKRAKLKIDQFTLRQVRDTCLKNTIQSTKSIHTSALTLTHNRNGLDFFSNILENMLQYRWEKFNMKIFSRFIYFEMGNLNWLPIAIEPKVQHIFNNITFTVEIVWANK